MGKLSKNILGLIIAIFSLVAVSGCTTLYQQAIAATRQPGEQIATTPDQLWKEMDCANREQPFV
jgi:uncharacterized protein YceK